MRILSASTLGGHVLVSFLARDIENARSVWKASQGCSLIGVAVRDYKEYDEVRDLSLAIKNEFGMVSLNLGGGDASQWDRITELAQDVDPGHVNQVFPALGYTLGVLKAKDLTDNVVNAVTFPGPTPGEVVISTGPSSESGPRACVPVAAACRMIREVGGVSLKVLGNCGRSIDRLAKIAKIAAEEGIRILEPAGGIDEKNVVDVVEACMTDNDMLIIPHIHTSVIEPATRMTDPTRVANVMRLLTDGLRLHLKQAF